MNLSAPVLDVAPTVRGALLHALCRSDRPITRRQLAASAGVAPGHASAVLEDLIDVGLVAESAAGRASLVQLNRDHLEALPVLALARMGDELVRRLRDELAAWGPALRGAWLFGSVARGDAERASDVDVLIVADDLDSDEFHERYVRLDGKVRLWTGNELQVVEYTPARWAKLLRSRSPLIDEIRRDGVALAGDTSQLLRRKP